MDGVAVTEGVQDGDPVTELVALTEAGDAQSGSIAKCLAQLRRRHPFSGRFRQRFQNVLRVLPQQLRRQLCDGHRALTVFPSLLSFFQPFGQSFLRFPKERHKVNGITPSATLFAAATGNQLSRQGRQNLWRQFPSNQFQQFHPFVAKVQQVTAVGKRSVGGSSEQQVGNLCR